jgi:23S rRNA pseudouridine1911/1915/1917 synthase
MFREKEIQKTYWAVVKNKPLKTEDTLVHYLKKNEAKNMSKAFKAEHPGALRSELSYKLIASIDNYYLLEVKPLTGRHHQIRVQLSAIGSPIKGDLKYGFPRSNSDASIHLHAREVEFIHPVKLEKLIIQAPPPLQDPVWKAFWKILA